MAEAMESKKALNFTSDFKPIGYFRCEKISKLQAARQGSEDESNIQGCIELEPGFNFEQALEDLDSFSHIWILFEFHFNKNWKPKVQPPRYAQKKMGVFATRAPYRPNNIGMTAAQLVRVQGRKIFVHGTDILDGSPILDLKPYLPFSDSFPKATTGWIQNPPGKKTELTLSRIAEEKIKWIEAHGVLDFMATISQQLKNDPFNSESKRVQRKSPTEGIYALRKWRIEFSIKSSQRKKTKNKDELRIKDIRSAFKKDERPHPEDSIHFEFREAFRPKKKD